ncbi:MAG: zinc-dependent alcohol dehydrogenase family protein [Chloroflexi bacterium]|nr:zinc-dependent alcohol dehydrogenase family protein [Chloroflexota bacterium]
MQAMLLQAPAPVANQPLVLTAVPIPDLGDHDLLVRVRVCGVCHTDLHVVEGDLPLPKLPIVPGHQIVGVVERTGAAVSRFRSGDRVGVPWLSSACGACDFCRRGQENLCDDARFTGYHVDGGFADYQVTDERFAYRIPDSYGDLDAAPLLCAGVIGYRALRLAGARDVSRLGLYGFGASAHLAIQVARHWGNEVYVFTRGDTHRRLAVELGAVWTGSAGDDPGVPMDSSIIFAPAGALVPPALRALRKGGTLTLAGIHMSPIPELDYALLWGERVVRTVANATRADAEELLARAADLRLHTEVQSFPLADANEVLRRLAHSQIRGAAALRVSD